MKRLIRNKAFVGIIITAIIFNAFTVRPLAKTSKKVDLTGDGKSDTVKIIKTGGKNYSPYTGLKIQINGRTVFDKKFDYLNANVKPIKISNKKGFLLINTPGDSDSAKYNGIFKYQNGHLKQVVDFNKCFSDHDYPSFRKVTTSGKTVFATLEGGIRGLGSCIYRVGYTWKNGKFHQNSNISNVRIFTNTKNDIKKGSKVSLSTDVEAVTSLSSGAVIKKLDRNTNVRFDKICFKGKEAFFSLVHDGQTYWVSLDYDKNIDSETGTYFTNTFYGGLNT